MNNCCDCGRTFVNKIKDATKECICAKWLCGKEADNTKKEDCLRYICHDCNHENRRENRRRDLAERELTPDHNVIKKPKEK